MSFRSWIETIRDMQTLIDEGPQRMRERTDGWRSHTPTAFRDGSPTHVDRVFDDALGVAERAMERGDLDVAMFCYGLTAAYPEYADAPADLVDSHTDRVIGWIHHLYVTGHPEDAELLSRAGHPITRLWAESAPSDTQDVASTYVDPYSDEDPTGEPATLTVNTRYPASGFTLATLPPMIVVDGRPVRGRWGDNPLRIVPGTRRIRVYVPSPGTPRFGSASCTVTAAPGETVALWYCAPASNVSDGVIGREPQKVAGEKAMLLLLGGFLLFVVVMCAILVRALTDSD